MQKKATKRETKRMFEIVVKTGRLERYIISEIKKDYKAGKVLDYAYIIHDKDRYTKEDVIDGKKVGELKDKHLHIGFRTKTPAPYKTIGNRYQVQTNMVEDIKAKNFGDYLAYLTHQNAPKKYQYQDDEVITTIENWQIERDMALARKIYKEQEKNKDYYLMLAEHREITRKDIGGRLPEHLYLKYKTMFDGHFLRSEKEEAQKINDNESVKQVIFIQGSSGAGKTTYAKKLANSKGMNYYLSNTGKDLLSGYANEECLILDDIRGANFKFDDFIKLIDNNSTTGIDSRYYNKLITSKIIIITSIQTLRQFTNDLIKTGNEPLVQVFRRIEIKMQITKDEIKVFGYNDDSKEYEFINSKENDILQDIETKSEKMFSTNNVLI